MLRRRVAGGVGALLRLLFGGVVDCRVRVRVQVVVLLCWGSAEGWSHEAWAGRTGMTEGVSGRSTREVHFSGGPRQGIREGWGGGLKGGLDQS